MQRTTEREKALGELRRMLQEQFAATARGGLHVNIARACGHTDGYMRGLLDAGLASQRELLAVVAEERARAAGPATRVLPSLDALPRGAA